ncbi:MAG: DUF4147 domain-containing protein [Cocleimonas sp.]|nr:DUF4147 domain-containing protein [Cocleimonas sp.]
MSDAAQDLRAIFLSAVDAVAGNAAVKKELATNAYPEKFHIVAIGKAADSMVQGVPAGRIISGLVISKHGHFSQLLQQSSVLTCLESDHPIPKENSLKAGKALIQTLENLPEKEPVLFLISGGASALVEVLQDGWDLEQLQNLTDYLLANAYPINEINTVRRHISSCKSGGVWSHISERDVSCLMISDVPDDDPVIIGSGLLFPTKENTLPELPQQWLGKLGEYIPNKVPDNFSWKIVACLDDAKKAAAVKAEALGYKVKIMPEFLQGDTSNEAKKCVRALQENKGILRIWGGETTVKLPANAGKGGRNQHLALAAAIEMDGFENAHLLAAGTDGSDGMTTATGAVVDGLTVQYGNQQKLKASEFLKRADSNSFFKDTGSLITTGATGTNVMDLVIGIYN